MFQVLLDFLETHETNLRKLVLRGNSIGRDVLKETQERLRELNRNRPDIELDELESSSSSSSSDSDGSGVDQYELRPRVPPGGVGARESDDDARLRSHSAEQPQHDSSEDSAIPRRPDGASSPQPTAQLPDDVKSSTTALLEFSMEGADAGATGDNDTGGSTENVRLHKNGSGSPDCGSRPNSRASATQLPSCSTKDNTSSDGSQLKTVDDYFTQGQTIYSNMYTQTERHKSENPPTFSENMKRRDDSRFAHVMRMSADGYG